MANESKLAFEELIKQFPKSDAVLSRLISFNIRVTWTEAELNAYLDKVEGAVRKVMEGVTA